MTEAAEPGATASDSSSFALERIRQLLATGLGPEGRLPTERALSESLRVSRRSVRRALEVLEAEGRIWRRQGAGTFAGRAPDPIDDAAGGIVAETDPLEVMEVRLRLEPQLAQLAALRARPDAVDRMREILTRLAAAGDADGRELWDSALHRTIAETAGNRLFLALFDLMDRVRQDPAWRAVRERARSGANLAEVAAHHAAIVEAIAARDPRRAGEAMRRHLMALHDRLIRESSMELSDAG